MIVANVAVLGSHTAPLSVILGLDPRTHDQRNQTNRIFTAFKLWVLGSSPRMTEMGGEGS
ncbi:hypothetical protein SAMN05443582_101796 [Phyllobacterium sp. OV277]|nr:hypothetical protein SAMN05443582_101796 [Phyllobacterium sp. OV277]